MSLLREAVTNASEYVPKEDLVIIIRSESFLNEKREVVCKCGERLYRYLKEPIPGEVVNGDDFEPIGEAPWAINGTEVRCYKCSRLWCFPIQEWITDEELQAENE